MSLPARAARPRPAPVLAEELLGALRDRQQAYDALLRLDDAAFPLGKLDAERLREATHDVEDEREALGLAAGGALFAFVGRLLVPSLPKPRRRQVALVARGVNRRAVCALERPEEECREQRFPSLSRLVRENDPSDPIRPYNVSPTEHCRRHLRLILIRCLSSRVERVRSVYNAFSFLRRESFSEKLRQEIADSTL
ncbi:MAG TPA: hypothetical protein VF515_21785 [Candidatus Binatia bacterium]